jgi:hypothetical protein
MDPLGGGSPVYFAEGDAPLKVQKEKSMKTLNASQALGASGAHFGTARALAFSLAESDSELLEPALVAWIDRSTGKTSPVLEGCAGPNGWRDYGISHGGRLEVDVDSGTSFIFAESSPFDSYEHFGPGPYINLRDAQGNESLCRVGGTDCVTLDEWTSKLT